MGSRRGATLAILAAAACTPPAERLAIDVPLTRPGLLAASYQGRVEAWVIEPSAPAPTLGPIEDWDGEAIALAVVEADPSSVELMRGPIPSPRAGEPQRTLADGLRITGAAQTRLLEGDTDTGWTASADLPELLGGVLVPDTSPCAGYAVRLVPSATLAFSFGSVAMIPPRAGVSRAIVGGYWHDRRFAGAGIGVVTSTDTRPALRPMAWPDLRPHNLAWDRRDTVWATITRAFVLEQLVVQIGLDGHIRHRVLLPLADARPLRFAFTYDDRVIAHSPGHVLELTTGSTAAVDRAADYPRRPLAIVEASAERRIVLDEQRVIWRHHQGAWVVETRELTAVNLLFLLNDRVYALSEADVFVRDDEAKTWSAIDGTFPFINKLSLAGLGSDRVVVSGGTGLLAIRRDQRGWCPVPTGVTRWVHGLSTFEERAVGFEFTDTPLPSILYWLERSR